MRNRLIASVLVLSSYMAICPAISDARPPFILDRQPELQQAVTGLFALYRTNRFYSGEEVEVALGTHLVSTCRDSGWVDGPIKTYCDNVPVSPNKNYAVRYSNGLNGDTPPQKKEVSLRISLKNFQPCLTLWELETFTQARFNIAPFKYQPVPFIPPNTKVISVPTVYELAPNDAANSDDHSGISVSVIDNCVDYISTAKVNAEVWEKREKM